MDLNIFENKYFKWSKYVISPLILIYIVYRIGVGEIYYAFQNFSAYYLFLAFLIFLSAFFLNFFPIYFLYKPLIYIPISDFLKYRGYSIALGIFTPMKLGELSLSFMLKRKYKISVTKSAVIMLFDKFISFIAVSFIFSVTYFTLVYFFRYSFLSYFQLYFLSALIITFFLFLFLIYSSRLQNVLLKIAFLGKYIRKVSDSFLLLYKIYRERLDAPFIDFLITFLSMITIVIPSYILFNSIGFDINFIYLLFIASAAGFFTLVPFTLSGLGVREVFVVYLYSLVNVPAPISLAMMLIFLLYRYSVPFLFILFFNFCKSD